MFRLLSSVAILTFMFVTNNTVVIESDEQAKIFVILLTEANLTGTIEVNITLTAEGKCVQLYYIVHNVLHLGLQGYFNLSMMYTPVRMDRVQHSWDLAPFGRVIGEIWPPSEQQQNTRPHTLLASVMAMHAQTVDTRLPFPPSPHLIGAW